MSDEETAFLNSMLAANESAGGYQMVGGASGQRAESISSDEYDPSQTVQTESLPASTLHSTANYPPVHEPLSIASDTLLNPTSTSAASALREASVSLSRSMSRASSETSDSIAITTHQQEPSQTLKNKSAQGDEAFKQGKDTTMGQGSSSQLQGSGSSLNISTSHVSADNVPIQKGVPEQKHSDSVQNGLTDTVPNLAAVIPDTGASSHSDSTVKPSETLPAPSVVDTRQPKKEDAVTPVSAAPKARLPHDRIGILEDRIKEDPQGDIDAWRNLISENRKRGKLEDARNVYERFLVVFPSAVCCDTDYSLSNRDVLIQFSRPKNGLPMPRWRTKPIIGLWWKRYSTELFENFPTSVYGPCT